MAVTDMTDSLPWWARQGASPTGAGPQPPQGGSQQAWLDYLASMFNPVGSAQAGEVSAGGFPPAAIAALNQGGTPPVPNNGLTVPPATASVPPGYAGSTGVSSGDPRGPDAAMNRITGMAPGVVNPGYQPPGIVPGRVNPNAPSAAATPAAALHPAAAAAPGPLANNRFIGIDAPNFSPQNSMRAGPQGTALNLAGLFGGGQPAAPAAGGAQNAPLNQTPMPPPRPRGPLAGPPGRMQLTQGQLANAVRKPNWWQSLGRPDMASAELASAVRKPNWWQTV